MQVVAKLYDDRDTHATSPTAVCSHANAAVIARKKRNTVLKRENDWWWVHAICHIIRGNAAITQVGPTNQFDGRAGGKAFSKFNLTF